MKYVYYCVYVIVMPARVFWLFSDIYFIFFNVTIKEEMF